MKMQQKKIGGGPVGGGEGDLGGCRPGIEVFVKMQKKSQWGPLGVGWLGMNQELKLL